ncbi:MAG: cryptochrome/photolyase family protein [Candidatus Azotimanducaceae bacterium WSBS_2022_MAG_OTU7]
MSQRPSHPLFLFRRDLRLADNTALNEALRGGRPVLAVFIIDPYLMKRWRHSVRRLAFLFQSLHQLQVAIKKRGGTLVLATGNTETVLPALINRFDIDQVFVNRGYSLYGLRQERVLENLAQEMNIGFIALDDSLLNPPPFVLKGDGTPYTIFTPYFRQAATFPVAPPMPIEEGQFLHAGDLGSWPSAPNEYLQTPVPRFEPGEAGAWKSLASISSLTQYEVQRDVPATEHTSHLSAHLRFGTCSARQVYAAVREGLDDQHPLVRQLYWRDFYHQIGWHFPHVFGHAFRRHYDAIPWRTDADALCRWKEGKTGFPIVDAGMRELAATGYMHNRVRMVTASFLTKNLHLDWRLGENHFAEQLIDFDPAVNNGNWQWSASTGCDAQPYFRIFNPWRQQQKFDKDCVYIKQWVPELRLFPAPAIHKLEKEGDFYIPKMVDLKKSGDLIKEQFKLARMQS